MWRSVTNIVRRNKSVVQHRNIVIHPRDRQAPPDPTRVSLLDLSTDIIHQILTWVQNDDPDSIFYLALVCSSLYHQARYVQFREFTLRLAEDASNGHNQLDYLQQNHTLLPAIRTLYIVGTPSFRKEHCTPMTQSQLSRLDPEGLLGHLPPLLPMMTGLSNIHWHEGGESMVLLPDDLLAAIQARPHIRLHVVLESTPIDFQVGPRMFPSHYRPQRHTMRTLQGSPNLVSLSVEYTYNPAEDRLPALNFSWATKKLILTCPSLRNLLVDMYPLTSSQGYHGFAFSPNDDREIMPRLETVSILNYPWGTDRRSPGQQPVQDWYGWQSDRGLLNCDGYPDGINCSEPEYWVTGPSFDWSGLVKLHDRRPVFAYYLAHLSADQIPNLKEVIFEYAAHHLMYPHGGATPALQFLLKAPQQLESISVSSLLYLGGDNAECVTRHGQTLKRLAIHNPEPGTDDPRWGLSALARREREIPRVSSTAVRDFLSNDGWNCDGGFVNHHTLQVFRDQLLMLEEIELDMDRGGTNRDEWPWSMLSILATFPRLRKVKIWFELGACSFKDFEASEDKNGAVRDDDDSAGLPRPYLTWGAAADMFRYLRRRKNKAGDAVVGIQQLELCTGAGVTHGHENKYRLQDWTGTEDLQAYWAAKNSTSFVCELALWHEGGFTVRCPRLNNEENRMLKRAAKAGKLVETNNLDFRVASRGPVSVKEWKSKEFQAWLKKAEKANAKKPAGSRLAWEKS